jgi:aminoglycoside phosphotransferase (APT) family kinase protein
LEELESGGVLIRSHARWFSKWLERLAPVALAPVKSRFLHNDLQSSNIMVNAGTHNYLAMIDWGDAGWGDPALELQWMESMNGIGDREQFRFSIYSRASVV